MQTKSGILTYNALHVSEVFHFKSGDSIVIQMKGEENLYSFTQSNYFGLYRVSWTKEENENNFMQACFAQ